MHYNVLMRLLIVEDEHKIANALKKGFEQEAFAVDVAYEGETGFDFASTENYDAIILDVMLPKISGTDICANLRKDEINIPILMLTAKSELENKVEGLNCGADDYLTKPFAFEELLARVKALIRRSHTNGTNVLKCDNLLMDLDKFTVTRNDEIIELSKKEFALLEYMIRNKNMILTKDKIIEHVWNYDADVLPNTVEVYIGYLRNKIDKPFIKFAPLIETIRGFGYRLKEQDV